MTPTLLYLIFGLTGFGGVIANRSIKGRKNIPKTILGGIFTFMFPGAAILLNLARRKRPKQGRDEREQEVYNQQFSLDAKKKKLENRLSQKDRLAVLMEDNAQRKGVFASLFGGILKALDRYNDRLINDRREDIRFQYEMLAMAHRRAESINKERFAFIRMVNNTEDGIPKFKIPYDMTQEQMKELKFILADKFHFDPTDPERFEISGHRMAEKTISERGVSLLVFDQKERTVDSFGKAMSDDVANSVWGVCAKQDRKREDFGLGETRNLIRMEPLGKDSVALCINNVVLAYAVAGEDGKVRAMGHGVARDDRNGMRLASRLNEVFKGCTDMTDWVKKAESVVMSDDNYKFARKLEKDEKNFEKKLKERKADRRRILEAPKAAVKSFSRSIG